MIAKQVFLSRSIASVVDQVLLSGLNFGIGIALIRFASKETYGLYSQLFAAGLLTTTLLDALIGSALTTLAMRMSDAERSHFVARAARIQWVASGILALIAGLVIGVSAVALELSAKPLVLGLSFAIFVFALGSREYCRTALFIDSRPDAVAKLDSGFVLLTLAGASSFLLLDQIEVHQVFLLLALSNGMASLLYSTILWRGVGPKSSQSTYHADAKLLWSLSRWAVIGAVVGWLGNNSYLYFAGGMAGVAALADLNAARLLLIPIVIIGMAWGKVARPTLGTMIANSQSSNLRSFIWKSTLAMEGFTLVYVATLLVAFPWLTVHVFGPKYTDILPLILLWGIYFSVNCARNVGTVLLTSYGAFQALFWQGVVSLLILMVATLGLTPTFGVKGALTAMIMVELWELVVNYAYMLPRARRQQTNLESHARVN